MLGCGNGSIKIIMIKIMQTFLKNKEMLSEDNRSVDLFDMSVNVKDFSMQLDQIDNTGIVSLVGQYGSGKTTFINQVMFDQKSKKWISFDAWKYPERKNLWEGFVLDLAKQINSDVFTKAKKKIDGDGKGAIKTLIELAAIYTNIKLPGAGEALKKFTYFFGSSPARRVFEIQEVLDGLLDTFFKNHDQDLVIVIEDADRAGMEGKFFLETLKNYLISKHFKNKVIALVPISDESYFKDIESYTKFSDFMVFFKTKKLDFKNFFDNFLYDNFPDRDLSINQLSAYFSDITRSNKNITLRIVKLIIRKAEINYLRQLRDGYEPDPRVCIAVETCNHIRVDGSSLLDGCIRQSSINRSLTLTKFLDALIYSETINDSGNAGRNSNSSEFLFNNEKEGLPTSIQVSINGAGQKHFNRSIAKFYFEYF